MVSQCMRPSGERIWHWLTIGPAFALPEVEVQAWTAVVVCSTEFQPGKLAGFILT